MRSSLYIIATVLLTARGVTFAGEWDVTGFVSADAQVFWESARYSGQDDAPNLSVAWQPEAYWQDSSGKHRVSLVGFARADAHDDERTHGDIRQAYWSYDASDWDINVGINKVFWGVAESRHLVDVINQTDAVEDVDQEDKLGQPMVNFNLQLDIGRFEFYVLPVFRERTFPSFDGRLRPELAVDADGALYESNDDDNHVDFAVRYSHYIGDMDVGVHIFDGTSREARFLLAPNGDRLLPFYEQMTQVGVDLQYTRDAWLWKFEALARDASSDDFVAAIGGFEYSFYGIRGSAADLGILLEYSYDGRNANAPPTSQDNDIFAGTRLALNDAQDTSVLAGFALDLDTNEVFFNVEAERRFGDSLSAELRLRAFTNSSVGDPGFSFARDDYLQLRLSWYY